jgi:hypothetical protein
VELRVTGGEETEKAQGRTQEAQETRFENLGRAGWRFSVDYADSIEATDTKQTQSPGRRTTQSANWDSLVW